MPVVNARDNPILLEEVLDEGLIDALKQGANYLKDKRTIRRFNRLNNNIMKSNNTKYFDDDNYKVRYFDAREAQDRKNQFNTYMKYRTSKEGRAEEKARKALQTKLTGKEKQIMKLQDKIAENKKKPGYNEDTDPDIKRLQQLTNDLNTNNQNGLKTSIENIRKYRDQQTDVPGTNKLYDGKAYSYKQGDKRVNPYNKNLRNLDDISDKSKINLLNQEKQLEELRKLWKDTKNTMEEARKRSQEKYGKNQRPSQIKPVPDVNDATDNKNLNQQAKNQFNQASKAAYGNRPVTAPAK